MSKDTKEYSLADLDAVTLGQKPFEFEFLFKSKRKTGLFLSVLGGECEEVAVETAALWAAERERQAALGDKYKTDMNELGKKMASIRLKGWRGIKEPWSKENAMTLCLSNKEIANAIIENSDNFENFIAL